jgi:hypothetical protein
VAKLKNEMRNTAQGANYIAWCITYRTRNMENPRDNQHGSNAGRFYQSSKKEKAMTDIHKEFPQWYNNRFSNRDPLCCEHGMEDMEEAYKAGRAHDVEGLIAEICDAIRFDVLQADDVEEIIRKHFGKE